MSVSFVGMTQPTIVAVGTWMLPRADASDFEGMPYAGLSSLNACIVESEAGGPARPACHVFTVQYSIFNSESSRQVTVLYGITHSYE